MHEQFVAPCRSAADLVVSGTDPLDRLVEVVVSRIRGASPQVATRSAGAR